MKLEVDISKRAILFISGLFIFILVVIGVNAWGGNTPSVMGHSLGELGLPSNTLTLLADTTPSDGKIDSANNALTALAANDVSYVNGALASEIDKGCNTIDTGDFSGGGNRNVDYKGHRILSLVKGSENICEDKDGCSISIARYDKDNSKGGRALWGQGAGETTINYYQLPDDTWPATTVASGADGKNGDSVSTTISEWYKSAPSGLSTQYQYYVDIYDDNTAGETTSYQLTVRDRSPSCALISAGGGVNDCGSFNPPDFAFIVSVCD